MKTALDWHNEALVDAAHADRNHPFSCPQCFKDVTPARGDINAAYFRHNDASPGCPDYHAGLGGSSFVGAADSRLELRVAVHELDWKLYLKLPDLTEKELALTSVTELQTRQLAIQHQNGDISRMNGLCLWPGSGITTAGVDPANQVRRVYTEGNWPRNSDRWNREVQQIPNIGAVFGQNRGGDYQMCTASRPLYLGSTALWVSPLGAGPPESLNPQKLRQYNGFTAWQFIATNRTVSKARQWLKRTGIAITEARDPTVVFTPPTHYRNDGTHVIDVDDSPIVAPSSVADALVAESNGVIAALRFDAPGQLARVTGGTGNIRIRTRSGDVLHIERQSSSLDRQFAQAWFLRVGTHVCHPYRSLEVGSIGNLKLEVTNQMPLEFSALVRYPNQFSTRISRMGADGLNTWLQLIRPDVHSLEISAGSFGVLRINRTGLLVETILGEISKPSDQVVDPDVVIEPPPLELDDLLTPKTVRSPSRSLRRHTAWSSAYRTLRGLDQTHRRNNVQTDSDWQWRIQQ